MATAPPPAIVRICDIPVSQIDLARLLPELDRRIQSGGTGGYISITNTESMYHALRIPAHLHYIQEADYSLCDGVGVIAAGWAWGHHIRRLNGPILLLECCRHGVARGWRHYFYGGKEGVAERMAANLQRMFPGLVVAGTCCPPFRTLSAAEDATVVERINAARPHFVWVGLGLLKQERWVADHLGRVQSPWMCGVGAAFDYHSGAIPWAPAWIRSLGLEWLFRLIIQPKLRARRYWWSLIFVLESMVRRIGGAGRSVA
jgi:N-acetylglucosaminyldiphosphoundecaprenol N-acetyl-beta-D-mannosaminyltransferase